MAASNFANCLAVTLREEGGWSDNPHDPGGATFQGVTQRVYNSWRREKGLVVQGVRRATSSEIAAIYRQLYWANVSGDVLPAGVDLMVFDEGVNSGPHRSILDLQRCVGEKADGIIGPVTLEGVNGISPAELIQRLADWRLSWLGRLVGWRYFGHGWTERVERVSVAAKAMLGNK